MGSGEITSTVLIHIEQGGSVLRYRILSQGLNLMDSLRGAPEKINSEGQILATLISNTLYRCNKWRLVKANAHRIEPDTPEEMSLY